MRSNYISNILIRKKKLNAIIVEDNEVISTHNMQNKQNNNGKTYAEVLMMKWRKSCMES